MNTDLTTTLTALLARWDALADEAALKLKTSAQPEQGGFYAGVMFGMESARDELDEVRRNEQPKFFYAIMGTS
jgi:hypothetical protein